MAQELLYEVSGPVATLTLNLPDKLNPLPATLQLALRDQLARIRLDRHVRVLVLTGAGRGFSVGADLSTMRGDSAPSGPVGRATSELMLTVSNPLIQDLQTMPVPVLSVVNGPAAGAGVGLALAADIVLAARSAYFYLPFMPRLGLVPDLGSTWFLPRAIGRSRTMGMALLGHRLSAEQAQQWGLIWACVDDAALASEADGMAASLAALPGGAAPELRQAFAASERRELPSQLDYEATRQRELFDRPSFAEGVQAFLDKRPPRFDGR